MTLIEETNNGIITDELKVIAEREGVEAEKVRRLVARGMVVVPRNERRETTPMGIGALMSTKINTNIGTSKDYCNLEEELTKVRTALKYGSDTLMDLSTGGPIDEIRKRILKEVSVPVGSVPIYQAALTGEKVVDMTSDDMFNAVRKHADDGIDFITVHCGVNLNSLERIKQSDRLLKVVSRGGSFTVAWMQQHGEDNPFYSEFDYLLDIAREYDLTLSLGDGLRPGCLDDATDRPKFMEFIILGELVKRCRAAGVQCIVEGPGHVPLDEIELSVKGMKHLTDGAPLYLLGPLVTDIAPGYDHLVGAIGGSLAGYYGTDYLCVVTPSEHLALPNEDDIKEGVIAARIAAHVADTVKEGQRKRARQKDRDLSEARCGLDWHKQIDLALEPEKPRRIIEARKTVSEACSMCGELCSIKITKEAFEASPK